MLVLPRNERVAAFGHFEDRSAELVPLRAAVSLLDRVEGGTFRIPVHVHVVRSVLIPAPGGAFDPGRGEGADLREEPLALFLAHLSGRGGFGFVGAWRLEGLDDRTPCDLVAVRGRYAFTRLLERPARR